MYRHDTRYCAITGNRGTCIEGYLSCRNHFLLSLASLENAFEVKLSSLVG
eukprot:m.288248 g.288248  ORF g.288248 m.288248 type:complete len:50 (+) comp19958_c0_seq2:175-324(+)